MTVSSAYLFGDRITAGEVPHEPVTLFENGVWNQQLVGQYYQPSGAYGPEAPDAFITIRPTVMESGKYAYTNSLNLYALGSKYQNLYTLNQTNISRTCTTGTSVDQSGCSVFIPLKPDHNVEKKQFSKITVEYKLTNTASHSHLLIGACQVVGDAYSSIGTGQTSVSGDWETLEVNLSELSYIDALEIQSTYGTYVIRKIVFE